MKITIIGGGNLGTAIANGLLITGYTAAENITVTKRNTSTLAHLRQKGVRITDNNQKGIDGANIVVIAVKPFQIKEVMEGCVFEPSQIIISVVTGVWLRDIRQWATKGTKVFRAMPNTAIAIRKSVTCVCYEEEDARAFGAVENLFNCLGTTVVIDEGLMDAATVLGACGIAFAMRYIRASIQGGIQIGFSAEKAAQIVSQTVNGAAELLLQTHTHPEHEIDKVTTPRGCTIAGLNELEHCGFSSSVIKGLTASFDKIS